MAIEGFREVDPQAESLPKIGIGLLGCGFIGQVHSNAYLKIPFTCQPPAARPQLVALCDTVGAEEKARKLGYQGSYADWKRMVEDPRIQVINNCTPDDMHCEPSVAAAEQGKHVICEKPLAMTAQQARTMMQAARQGGVKTMCCHNYRFLPAVRNRLPTGGDLSRETDGPRSRKVVCGLRSVHPVLRQNVRVCHLSRSVPVERPRSRTHVVGSIDGSSARDDAVTLAPLILALVPSP